MDLGSGHINSARLTFISSFPRLMAVCFHAIAEQHAISWGHRRSTMLEILDMPNTIARISETTQRKMRPPRAVRVVRNGAWSSSRNRERRMQKPDRSSYTTLDFQSWEADATLSLSPKFQRRSVWKNQARTHFIDTLLKGMPVPPIYLRVTQNDAKTKTIREVIDGQQRLRAVIDYMKDGYALAKAVSDEAPGRKFSALASEQQDRIRQYAFVCESFVSITDEEVLEVFRRLNTNAVKLNAQELRNGLYFGHFKRLVYKLAQEHLSFWRNQRIFTEVSIARMQEAELMSELLIAQLDGLQDKKASIDRFYADYDEQFAEAEKAQTRFRTVVDTISEALDTRLSETEFRRPPLFYSLYTALYHRLFRLPKSQLATPAGGKLSRPHMDQLAIAVVELSDAIRAFKAGEAINKADQAFVNACQRQTDNLQPRQVRFETVFRRAFK